MNKKTLDFQFEVKEMKETDDGFFTFEGYASTFGNVDRGDDVVIKGAFKDTLDKFMPKLLWQHDMKEPLGIFTNAFEDEKGLFVSGKMPKEDDLVKGRVIPQMKVGSIDRMSIGFNIDDSEEKVINGKEIRNITKLTLWEVSLVTIPMNDKATVTSMKAVVPFQDLPIPIKEGEPDVSIPWSSSEAVKRVRDFNDSKESPSKDYKNAFLWYDKEGSEKFGSYKLPIADVIDGKLVAIPKAIFAAASALSGARGGVDIPSEDKEKVVKNINRYYEKMGRPSPLEKGFSLDIDSMGQIKDISDFLKNYGLSNNESNSLISSIKRISRKESSARNETEALKKLVNGIEALKKKTKEML